MSTGEHRFNSLIKQVGRFALAFRPDSLALIVSQSRMKLA
jgi:hypothetical protein